MKVGILTFHRASNYGAVLQAYALLKSVSGLGHDCSVVDYRSDYMEKLYGPFPFSNTNIKQKIGVVLNAPVRISRKRAFDKFRRSYLATSKPYNASTVSEAEKEYDAFIFGSDQVWNNKLNGDDANYFGKFVNKACLYAYAASIGRIDDKIAYKKMYSEMLKRFQKVGIREQNGVMFYQEITQNQAREVIDPVLLLTDQTWKKLATKVGENKKYILLYHLQGGRTKVNECAHVLAKKTGLPIVDVQSWMKKYPHNVEINYNMSPEDFLGYILNAEYVVTDSFHCTAFAIIFGKKIWCRTDSMVSFENSRVGNLLLKMGLETRVIPMDSAAWCYNEEIDYSKVWNKLELLREDSLSYLREMLK